MLDAYIIKKIIERGLPKQRRRQSIHMPIYEAPRLPFKEKKEKDSDRGVVIIEMR